MLNAYAQNCSSPAVQSQSDSSTPAVYARLWAVKNDESLSPSVRLLYDKIVSMAWTEGRCFPGTDYLAAFLGKSMFTVFRCLNVLETRGLLVIHWERGRKFLYPTILRRCEIPRPGSSRKGSCNHANRKGGVSCNHANGNRPSTQTNPSVGQPPGASAEALTLKRTELQNVKNVGGGPPPLSREDTAYAPEAEALPDTDQGERRNGFSLRPEESGSTSDRPTDEPDISDDGDTEDPAMIRAMILESLEIADRLAEPPTARPTAGMVPIADIVRAVAPQRPVAVTEEPKPQDPPVTESQGKPAPAIDPKAPVRPPAPGAADNPQVETVREAQASEPYAYAAPHEENFTRPLTKSSPPDDIVTTPPRKFKAFGSRVDMNLVREIEDLTCDYKSRGCFIKILRYARPETVQTAMAAVRAVKHEQSGVNLGAYFVRVVQKHEPGIVGATVQGEAQATRPTPVPKPPKVQPPPEEARIHPRDMTEEQFRRTMEAVRLKKELMTARLQKKITPEQHEAMLRKLEVALDG